MKDGQLQLTGRVLDPAGTRRLEAELFAAANDAESLGQRVANELLKQGAAELISGCRD